MVDKQKDFRTVKVHHARAQAPAVVENDNGVVQVQRTCARHISDRRLQRQEAQWGIDRTAPREG
jgi:hypothetical protein